MSNLQISIFLSNGGDVVGPVDEDYMHKSHAREEWYQGQAHDPVFSEQLVAPDLSTTQAGENDDGGEYCCPPAVE